MDQSVQAAGGWFRMQLGVPFSRGVVGMGEREERS